MTRHAQVERITTETSIHVQLDLDGSGNVDIQTGIPFFDHMLILFGVHGFFDLTLSAKGDLEVDWHHTVEDVGLVLGTAFDQALGERKGIRRYGHAATPMDETLSTVTIDLSNRPYLVYHIPTIEDRDDGFSRSLAKEFFRAFSTRAGMNLHINVCYGENWHHVIESIFKATGRSMAQAVSIDSRTKSVRSTKGAL